MEFPASLYKRGSAFLWDGEWFDFVNVNDAEEMEIALADGWVSHKPGGAEPEPAKTDEQPVEAAPVAAPPPRRRGRKPKGDA